MIELLEFIDDLKMLDALDPVAREGHLQCLIEKYQKRFDDHEEEMSKQMELFFGDTPFSTRVN